MKRTSVAAIITGGLGAGAAAAMLRRKVAAVTSWRTRRMWRLTARNAGRFATHAGEADRSRPAERRAELDAQFAIRTAEDVAKELGEMKGVLMKVGQMVSFIAEGLPDEAQQALAALQADAAPMAPTLAAEVDRGRARRRARAGVRRAGRTCRSPRRASARSTGPATPTGRELAVKVQFPGVAEAIEEDLDAAEVMYTVFSALALNGLDARALVDELRAADARGARLPPRGAPTSPSSPGASPAIRGCASRRWRPSSRRRRC